MEKLRSFLLENKTNRQTFFKNSFWLVAGNIVSKILRGGLIILAARILQTEGYGIYAYALSFAGFFTIFSDIGLSSLLTRELTKHRGEDINSYIATTFYVKIFLVALSVALTALVGPHFTKIAEVRTLMPIVAFLTAFDSMRGFFYSITRSANQMEIEARSILLTEISIDSLSVAALLIHPAASWVLFAYVIGDAIGCLAIGWRTRSIWLPAMKKHFDKKLVKQIVGSAWPFAIMGLLGSFMINIDSIVIGWFRSTYELGLYAAAQKPVQLLYILPSLFSTGLFPIITKMAHQNEKKDVENATNKLFRGVILIALPITFGGIVLGQSLVNFIFGASYAGAALTFELLLLTLAPVFAGIVWGNVIFAYDKQKIFIITSLVGAILNTGLDFILIPSYGLPGSAVATIISQLASNGYTWYKLNKIVAVPIFKGLGRGIFATALMCLAVFGMMAIGISIIPTIIAGMIMYPLLLALFKEPLLKSIPIVDRFVR